MSGQPWYRHNPRDFLDGIVGMTPDLIGAYIVTLDLIYARGGPIPNEQRWLGGVMGCSPRAATSLVNRLVEAGKLHLIDGKLTNDRASFEIENAASFARKQVENGAKGGRTRTENDAKVNNIKAKGQATLKPIHNSTEDKKEDSSNELSSARPFDEFWAAYPKRIGKADAQRAWAKASRVAVPAHILAAAKAYALHPPDDPRFIPNPATWLNGGRYDDPIEEPHNVRNLGGNHRDTSRPVESTNPRLIAGKRAHEQLVREALDAGRFAGRA